MRKTLIIFLFLLFLLKAKGYSQNVPNGYYNQIVSESGLYLYVHNDTIILPYANGMMYVAIRKGVIDKKRKWINFIPIPIQERSQNAVYDTKKQKKMKFRYFKEDQRIEVLFNMPFNNYWNKYVKTQEPQYKGRSKSAIEKHINNLNRTPN